MKLKHLLFIVFILQNSLFSQVYITNRLFSRLEKLSDFEYIRTLVLLKDRVDINELDRVLYQMKVSPEERAYIVITTLKDKANSTQGNLKNYLETKILINEVKSYQSFWITNLIMIEAVKSVILELANNPEVELIDLDDELRLDPYVNEGPAPENVQGSETGLKVINADKLWKMGITGQGRLVMNIDTGVEGSHPAFSSRWRGNFVPWNQAWFDPETNTSFPTDCDDHGSHTMGIMTGRAGSDTIGVAFDAQWIAAKTICSSPHTSKSIAAFQWAMDPDGNPETTSDMPDVISNSWYDPNATDECIGIYKLTFDAVEAAGITIVFSAGNNGPGSSTITKPKNINTNEVNVFAVGNINGNTTGYPIASSSSRGPSTCGGSGSLLIKPEVVAPGTSVRSAIRGGGYGTMSGTSMASPHVAGAIALLKQAFPYLTGQQIKYALYNTAVDLGDFGEDNTYGKGLIDVFAAFLYLANRDSIPPTTVTNLEVIELGSNSIKLRWTAPFDGSPGGVISYDIRYSTTGPINDSISFAQATKITNVPYPDSAGRIQTFLVKGLDFNTTYYFTLRSKDVWNNWSNISNSPNGRTLFIPQITVQPDSLILIKPKNITFIDSVIISNTSHQPSTLDFEINFQNHTFPSKNLKVLVQSLENENNLASNDKILDKKGNGFSITGSGGPDLFGYRWKDSDDPSGPQFSWTSISDIGVPLTLTDDSYSTQTLPFQFSFYGTNYSQVEVVSNGYLRFTNYSSTYPTNGSIPSTSNPNNAIYGFWDDLNPGAGGNVYVYSDLNKFIVEFNNVPRYNDLNSRMTFQIELQKNGTIYFRYKSMTGTLNSATIGIENAQGTDGLLIVYNSSYVKNDLAIRIQKEPEWISVNNISGIIPNGGSMALKLFFDTHDLMNGNYRMEMKITSNDTSRTQVIVPINMTITDTNLIVTSIFSVNGGWNLVSVPVLTHSKLKNDLFPTSNSYAYGYVNNYVIRDSLFNGFGYWLKFPSSQNIQMIGTSLNSITIPINSGWNLIGSLNSTISVNDIVTNPPNIISGLIYGYNNSYFVANTIEKGKAYWVKASSNGTLTLNTFFTKEVSQLSQNIISNNWHIIEFQDNNKNLVRLFLGENIDLEKYELPPLPPSTFFDVRFGNDCFVDNNKDEHLVRITSENYPIKVKLLNANGQSYELQDAINGSILHQTLKDENTIVITNPNINLIRIKKSSSSFNYSLMQNYPNPFNPSTIINFSVPEKSKVKILVYNSLGEGICSLIDDIFDKGIHQVEFNSHGLPSGIYYYKMISGGFSQTRKLVIIK